MPTRCALGAALLAALGGCQPDAPAAGGNASAANVAAPAPPEPGANAAAPAALAPDAPLRDWLVGAWSFEASCATDFIVHYEADGALDNAGEAGRWALAGDQVTETVTERFENGGEAPVKVDPPIVRSYRVARKDATHGTITIDNRRVDILRC